MEWNGRAQYGQGPDARGGPSEGSGSLRSRIPGPGGPILGTGLLGAVIKDQVGVADQLMADGLRNCIDVRYLPVLFAGPFATFRQGGTLRSIP